MLLKDIVSQVNKLLSNNSSFKLSYDRLKFYINTSIDYINSNLFTDYPTPDELYNNNKSYYSAVDKANEYNYIPVKITNVPNKNDYYFDEDTVCLYYNNKIVANYEIFPMIYIIENGNLYYSESKENENYIKLDYTINPNIPIDTFNYDVLPDRYIRSCIVYYTASAYLEEEDELESQYHIYKNNAESELSKLKQQYYSMYDTTKCTDKEINKNPYSDFL